MEFAEFLKNYRKYPNFLRYKGIILFVDYDNYKRLKELAQKWQLTYLDVREVLKNERIFLDKSFSPNILFDALNKKHQDLLVNNVDLVLSALDEINHYQFFEDFLKREFSNLIVFPILFFQNTANKAYKKGYGKIFSLGG